MTSSRPLLPARDLDVAIRDAIPYPEALETERQLLREIAIGDGAPRFAVWRTPQALIVPRGMPGRENFASAAAGAEDQGWPVYERDTGGDLTPQTPGMVNLSLVFRMEDARPSIESAYRRLTAPVLAFLKSEFGLDATTQAVPGAFCDGAYNIAFGGQKLAGTAQRWRLLNAGARGDFGATPASVAPRPASAAPRPASDRAPAHASAVLAHVALMCTIDLAPAIEMLNAFYRDLGIDRHVERDKHVTLEELFGRDKAGADKVAKALEKHLSDDGF
jgi:hypothetical protein